MLRAAGTFASETEPQQLGQVLFGILAVQLFGTHLELATFAMHEALAQTVVRGADSEIELDAGRGRRLTPGQQVIDTDRTVALKERRADGTNKRALSSLVGAGEQVQAWLKACKLKGLTKLPQLFDLEPVHPHAAVPAAWRSVRMLVSKPSAWPATSALASPSGPPCRSRSSVITSPR